MSRAKSRHNVEVCGDCGGSDATWASVNKGILLCTQCCSIHRSLGRHISQVKSLQKSTWHPNQLAMVCTLNNNGANNIWEHLLLENNSKFAKKKPGPKDSLAAKSEFIKAKHLQCAYAFRENYEDGLLSVENELGKQLHASVRTSNLETSFRLLILGADPNYFHDEKGSTPLHVAAKSDQKLQVELLLTYGADPTYPDSHGKTPLDYAKLNVNKDLYNRLVENQYDITDTFVQYLTLKKPDHSSGVHFHVPAAGFETNLASLTKLQKIPNHLFEELVMDVYDEIDRRETEAIWYSCVDTIDLSVVPFLPVDSTLSTTRNQGRQKLARFSTPELKSLVYDILIDTQRRQTLAERGQSRQLREFSQISDDDPLYDSVASDDDYAVLPPIQENTCTGVCGGASGDKVDVNETTPTTKPPAVQKVVENLTKQLQVSDCKITDLKAEVNKLKACLESLTYENHELKNRLSQYRGPVEERTVNGVKNVELLNKSDSIHNGEVDLRQSMRPQRPSSMYETREGIQIPNWHLMKSQLKQGEQSRPVTQSLYASPQDRQTVLDCTVLITRSIQHLCNSIQDRGKEDCVSSWEKVKFSVAKLASILPTESDGDTVKLMLDIIPKLFVECSQLQMAHSKGDKAAIDKYLINIRQYAFHLAKYNKDIVTKYSSGQ